MERENVILDTDISNEVDDQFALCYLLKSLDKLNLNAITIAPFSSNKYAVINSLEEGLNLSYETACKLLEMTGFDNYKSRIFKGANTFFGENKNLNEASKKIIEIALSNEHTTIIAIGAITNVAVAIFNEPRIAEKIKVIWLGGHSFLTGYNTEYNFRQDVTAVRFVFNSNAELVVIPCKNVAQALNTTIYELDFYLKEIGELGKYLCKIVKDCNKAHRKDETNIIGEAKPLWDISAVAYAVNENWFESQKVSVPEILDDKTYKMSESERKITFVNNMDRNQIFKDLFLKLGYKYEI